MQGQCGDDVGNSIGRPGAILLGKHLTHWFSYVLARRKDRVNVFEVAYALFTGGEPQRPFLSGANGLYKM